MARLTWAQISSFIRAYSCQIYYSQSSGLLRIIVVDELDISGVILTNRQRRNWDGILLLGSSLLLESSLPSGLSLDD